MLRRLLFLAVAVAALALLSACGTQPRQSKSSTAEAIPSSLHGGTIDSTLPATADLNTMARTYASTPGRIALSLIICRLDRSSYLQPLAQKSAQDLFSMLREVAAQNSQTLESLNTQFHLTDILSSEGIYVQIHANAADPLSTPIAPAPDWITQFQSAYASLSSASSQA
ncbi:hypothetical protein [Ethanoligenens harbinense]|uniref:Lipoprotein n=1 Tax=Ethanoligenens harbinense (strain DSM 18485 / JCM 12961 / CGMCC 1.5033 / YUAN-3) TaxID=663278 RepID=E6U2J1_ETHHY|nr:hypothetical protein [Ethanoligenens harbinense]ADU26282.1 hypothetical protein Ethha_0713 [Ethanoligenens harbinense YUAN-3]AVQ95416.1 hypothetical protein CXQ68_03665 [Ethanoligenens harbinense YUAN-3]AYF38081.1 hypothetical protein CXP51_03520 [Ethanoligenens harbinense]AYF40826.1 hypothetical protein CN246_03655 [Ethanoligenens harbinense]QCN91657.1 hypothetical protein DRA42_03660 [Ethanoligenens harbinense]